MAKKMAYMLDHGDLLDEALKGKGCDGWGTENVVLMHHAPKPFFLPTG